jgi:predicted transcriptional regulator
MQKRREAIDLAKDIYLFLKKNQEEYSINRISKQMKAKYEITVKCLVFLKEIGLLKERKGENKPIPERFFSLK